MKYAQLFLSGIDMNFLECFDKTSQFATLFSIQISGDMPGTKVSVSIYILFVSNMINLIIN